MAREPYRIIATGTTGVGKTHTTLEVIERYVQNNPAIGRIGRKVLIYDVNMEYTNAEIQAKGANRGRPFSFQTKELDIKDLAEYTQQTRPEVRRILPIDANGHDLTEDGMVDRLSEILRTFRNGLLLLEDYNAYLIGTSTKEIISAITRNRHKDMDIYIHLQSLAPVTPRMWQNCNYIRFHKQSDEVFRYKDRIPTVEKFYITEKIVDAKYESGDVRFYCYVHNQMHKITGKFSVEEFQAACYSYLLDNPQFITQAQKRLGGVKASTREPAIQNCIRGLMKYYGNKMAA